MLEPGWIAGSAISPRPHRGPLFMSRTSFDPAKDFTYIIGLSGYTFGVAVRSDAPWKTFPELLAAAKANPGTITYGTPGAGTSLHITMEQIAREQGIKLVHVPFKGNAEATTALLGGHIHALADSSGWAPQVNEGKLRLLVSWGASRTRNWPTVPTLREIGIDIVSNSPHGIGRTRQIPKQCTGQAAIAFHCWARPPRISPGVLRGAPFADSHQFL